MDSRPSGKLHPSPAIGYDAAVLCEAVNVCFEDYVVPFVLTPPAAERRWRRESVDAEASTVWSDNEGPAAVTMIARRGWDARLAAMAVAKRLRGQGVGRFVMEEALRQAQGRGDRRMVLEVIEQNPPAIGLYEAVGFRKTRRIVGWERPPSGQDPDLDDGVVETDPASAVRAFFAFGPHDIPWNLQPFTLAQLASPTRAYALAGQCFALVTDTPGDRTVLWQIATDMAARGQGLGRRMVQGIARRHPTKTVFTSVDVPEDVARGFFEGTGFREMAVSQWEMAQDL